MFALPGWTRSVVASADEVTSRRGGEKGRVFLGIFMLSGFCLFPFLLGKEWMEKEI